MPAWWGRKSNKSKDQLQQNAHVGSQWNFTKNDAKKGNSPRPSKDFASLAPGPSASSPAGLPCFDSDGAERKGIPLPKPSVSSTQSFGNDHNTGLGSGSVSVSSFSSSGSSDDHPISQFRLPSDSKFLAGSRSAGPGSRGPTSPTSPLHSRLQSLSLDSPTGKQEDARSECHPLPLPPGPPSSPSTLSGTRTINATENITGNLSKWKKGKLLGRGTFGHVYLGFNSESGQMCAIKEVRVDSDDQSSKESLKQLSQEINLLSRLSHPNIVQYYGSELSEERLSVYLEYVSGGSIHKLLQEYGAFNEPVIQNYTRKLISGLAYLHGGNKVHRDIKGANILVDPNGEIKLADFGMAKHITTCSSMLSFKGSPYWMAPEVVMNTNGYSLAVDIWSLGCTVLEMATSKPPWSQFEGVAAIFKIGNSRDIPELPDHLSHHAKSFIKLCLQRDPSARPTASQLLEHPFIQDQSITRVPNTKLMRDTVPYLFEGSRTLPVLELRTNRRGMTSIDGDYMIKPATASPQALRSPVDNARTITSLPVSPSSSPLRQNGPAYRGCYFSPQHPTFTAYGNTNSSLMDLPSYSNPVRSNTLYTLDPWRETSSNKAQTPGGSPRTRP